MQHLKRLLTWWLMLTKKTINKTYSQFLFVLLSWKHNQIMRIPMKILFLAIILSNNRSPYTSIKIVLVNIFLCQNKWKAIYNSVWIRIEYLQKFDMLLKALRSSTLQWHSLIYEQAKTMPCLFLAHWSPSKVQYVPRVFNWASEDNKINAQRILCKMESTPNTKNRVYFEIFSVLAKINIWN